MPGERPLSGFLKSRQARVLTLALIVQATLFYTLSHGEAVPILRPLNGFPIHLGEWEMMQEGVIEQEILDVLGADDTLNRVYLHRGAGRGASLFVAYFMTQRTGQTPHSPKNCLPGGGWVPASAGEIDIAVPGEPDPIRVNHYVVARGEDKSVVLYWYQTSRRVIASEYSAKIHLVLDSIRYSRSDTAIVRVVVPVSGSEQDATEVAVEFVKAFFTPLRDYLPE